MKFRDGYWGIKDGVKLLNPAETRDVSTSPGELTIYSPCKKFTHRGDTLNAPLLTTTFSSPLPDVVRVRMVHFAGARDPGPFFEVAPDRAEGVAVERGAGFVSLRSGGLEVRASTEGPWSVDFFRSGKRLTGVSGKHSGYAVLPDGSAHLSQHLTLSVGENVYGLGERFTAFAKNGQVVDLWNEDGGTSSEQAYKNIPFYLTNRGYGVFVSHPGKVSFEVASEVVTSVQFSVPGEAIDYYIVAGDSLKDVLRNYAALTGRPALPPAWSFGLWLTTSFTTTYDEQTVNSFIDGMAERGIPLRVFHFDCFWMKEYQWVDFRWDTDQFPDPAAMLARLRAKGLELCLWINPYVAQKSALFAEGMRKGYLVKKADGSAWQWDRWQAGMGLVDFTNPEAAAWFRSKLAALLDSGIAAFKTDFGERIPTNVVWHDGSDPQKMHNYYTHLYNRTVFGLLEERRGKGGACVFARSATAGGQQYPVHWGGDCSATYESMAESLRGGLSLSLSGFAFWSHDMGGFERTATPDLFKRWCAFGLLSSHSRLHGNESYRVPWNFDDEASAVLRFFARLKCTLMPYLYAQSRAAAAEGVPVMRPMVLEYPEDPACAHLDRQYFLGEALLVAPIFSEDGVASYYLPGGTWTNFITGERISGGAWRSERHGYLSLPLMVRPGSVVAVGSESMKPDYDYEDGVAFHVFELEDGAAAETALVDLAGKETVRFRVERRGRTYRATAAGATKPWSLVVRGTDARVSAPAGTQTLTAET
jgi:alpha-D-xyloside xylohydrolase